MSDHLQHEHAGHSDVSSWRSIQSHSLVQHDCTSAKSVINNQQLSLSDRGWHLNGSTNVQRLLIVSCVLIMPLVMLVQLYVTLRYITSRSSSTF